jgi:hypothetical protein
VNYYSTTDWCTCSQSQPQIWPTLQNRTQQPKSGQNPKKPILKYHLFLNCPIMSARWREIAKWLGITMVLPEGGYGLLVTFKNIISEK